MNPWEMTYIRQPGSQPKKQPNPWELQYENPAAENDSGLKSYLKRLPETALTQGMQGASFGFIDEPVSGLSALMAKGVLEARELMGGEKAPELADLSRQAYDASQASIKKQQQTDPVTSVLAQIGGGLAASGGVGATKAGAAAGRLLRSGNTAARVGKGVATGAASGALYGAGSGQEGSRSGSAVSGALYGGALGGALPLAGAAISRLNTKVVRPTADALKSASQKSYAAAEGSNAVIDASVTNDFIDRIAGNSYKDPMAAAISGKNPLTAIADDLAQFRGQPMNIQRAIEVDQALTKRLNDNVFYNQNGVLNDYGQELLDAKEHLRDLLMGSVEKGAVKGDASGVNSYMSAIKDWAAQSRIREIEAMIERAGRYDNPATAMRTAFRNIANNQKRLNKYPKQAQNLIKKAAEDSDFANMLRTEVGSRLISTAMGAALGASTGGLGVLAGAATGAATSRVARKAAEKMQLGRVNKIKDSIASTSSIPTQQIDRVKIPNLLKQILLMPPAEAEKALKTLTPAQKQEAIKLLPAPTREIIVGPGGAARQATQAEQSASLAARQRADLLGLTPDVRRAAFQYEMKRKFADQWNKIDAEKQRRIADEVEMMWRQNKMPVEDMLKAAKERAEVLAKETGETFRSGAFGEALMRATQKKR